VKVVWTTNAQRQLDAIREYVAASSPEFAHELVDRITARSNQIADFPESGRLVPGGEALALREIFEASYRIVYIIAVDRADVVAVVHGGRDLLRASRRPPRP
jgi:plasmid stabilization system protein ParE